MGDRRRAREYALQMLYQIDRGGPGLPEGVAAFWEEKRPAPETRRFAESLVAGTVSHLPEIDSLLREGLEHWRLPRVAAVDRAVLRLAVYEFLFETETPRVVVIDEAVDLAKKFGGEGSGLFVNGVLDWIRKRVESSATPSPPAAGFPRA